MEQSTWRALLLLAIINHASAQSLSGCHNHGAIQFCYGPDGKESSVSTAASSFTTPSPANAVTTAAAVTGSIRASLSGCHSHGATEFCFLPNGEETAVSRQPSSTEAPQASTNAPAAAAAAQTTAVTACHMHETTTFCIDGNSEEVQIKATGTRTGEPPAQFTDCHSHGKEKFCLGPEGGEVQILAAEAEGSSSEAGTSGKGSKNCHFHAGVEHCIGADGSESEGAAVSCGLTERDYNKSLRIGALFVILVTSGIGVFGPILLTRFFSLTIGGMVFTVIKQFGTGVIISTALVHLLTHSQLMFANKCLGELAYEATTTAVVMAGFFLSFLVEYFGLRLVTTRSRSAKATGHGGDGDVEHNLNSDIADDNKEVRAKRTMADLSHNHAIEQPKSKLSVVVMEAGIIFHSILIGVTLIVSGDSFFVTLFIVVIFHQTFEGLALGARIADLRSATTLLKLVMATAFALITPVGMAIGLGVLNKFNGNDKSTIITIGTLDGVSAGILLWVGIVDMWSHDWLHGDLQNAGACRTLVALFSLIAGLILMSFLGKWA